MSVWVVDASVAVKWYLCEPHSEEALSLLDEKDLLVVPDLLFCEVASALCKRTRKGEIDREEAIEWQDELAHVPLLVEASHLYATTALRLALETGRTPYDSLYLALALGCHGVLVTADEAFCRALERSEYGDHVRWIGDLPTKKPH